MSTCATCQNVASYSCDNNMCGKCCRQDLEDFSDSDVKRNDCYFHSVETCKRCSDFIEEGCANRACSERHCGPKLCRQHPEVCKGVDCNFHRVPKCTNYCCRSCCAAAKKSCILHSTQAPPPSPVSPTTPTTHSPVPSSSSSSTSSSSSSSTSSPSTSTSLSPNHAPLPTQNLTCGLCQSLFSDPVKLPCGHCFDIQCLVNKSEGGSEEACVCPSCPTPYSVNDLPAQKVMMGLIENYRALKSEIPKHVCISCSSEASKYCHSCKASICSNCLRAHADSPFTKHHELIDAQDLQIKICGKHDKQVEYFCQSCLQTVCTPCVVLEHTGHALISISEASNRQRYKLLRARTLLTKRLETVRHNHSAFEAHTKKLEACIADLTSGLKSFQDLARQLHQRCSEISQIIDGVERLTCQVHDIDLIDPKMFRTLISMIESIEPKIMSPFQLFAPTPIPKIEHTYRISSFPVSAVNSLVEYIGAPQELSPFNISAHISQIK